LDERHRQLRRAGSATILGNTYHRGSRALDQSTSFVDVLAHPPRSTQNGFKHSGSWIDQWTPLASSVSTPPRTPDFQGEVSAQLLLDGVRLRLRRQGFQSTKDLERLFEKLDTQGGDRVLDLSEFTAGMLNMGLLHTADECRAVFEQMDTDKSGTLELEEFLTIAKGVLPEKRLALVKEAFSALLRPDDRGVASLRVLQDTFCTEHHPDRVTGQRTESQIWEHFQREFSNVATRGRVTLNDFIRFYEGISAVTESDAYFEAVVRKSWNLAGGAGASANVKLFDSKGRSTSVTVRGIQVDRYHPFFEDVLKQRLAEQGFVDVCRLEIS